MNVAQVRGADLLVDTLVKAGVDVIFGCSGDSVLPIYDALFERKDIRYIGVRHEQGAAHAADAYARVTGKPGVFLVHVGPGALNTPIAVATAYKDDSPLIGLIMQQEQHKLGRDVFHEIDQLKVFDPICKWTYRISRPNDVAHYTMEAVNRAMSGRRGPVILELPKDSVNNSVPEEAVTPVTNFTCYDADKPRASRSALEKALAVIQSARRPMILAGAGIHWSQSYAEFEKCARLLGVPVVTTCSGRTVIPEDHVLWSGFPGTFGMITGGKMMKSCDCIVGIGTKFSDNATAEWKLISPGTKIVHVDIDPLMLGRQLKTEVAINADAKAFLQDFNALLEEKGYKAKSDDELRQNPAVQDIRKWLDEEESVFFAPGKENTRYVQPQYIIQESMKVLPKDAFISTGAGAHRIYADRVRLRSVNSYVKSVNFGALGFSFPAAMGVKVAMPDRPVLCMTGDGDFMMVVQELETLARENIPVIVVVFNNQGFQSTKHFQKIFFQGRTFGQDFGNPDYAELGKLFGCEGYRVDRLDQYGPALEAALKCGKPAIIDVYTDPDTAPYEIASLGSQMKDLVGVKR